MPLTADQAATLRKSIAEALNPPPPPTPEKLTPEQFGEYLATIATIADSTVRKSAVEAAGQALDAAIAANSETVDVIVIKAKTPVDDEEDEAEDDESEKADDKPPKCAKCGAIMKCTKCDGVMAKTAEPPAVEPPAAPPAPPIAKSATELDNAHPWPSDFANHVLKQAGIARKA